MLPRPPRRYGQGWSTHSACNGFRHSMTWQKTSGEPGTLTYSVNGVNVTKSLTRQPVLRNLFAVGSVRRRLGHLFVHQWRRGNVRDEPHDRGPVRPDDAGIRFEHQHRLSERRTDRRREKPVVLTAAFPASLKWWSTAPGRLRRAYARGSDGFPGVGHAPVRRELRCS